MSLRVARRLLLERLPRRVPSTSTRLAASVAPSIAAVDGSSQPTPRCPLGLLRQYRVFFSTQPSALDQAQNPAVVEYRSLMAEEEFHRLADETIHDLLEKFEEYGDAVHLDGYEIDYGNHVLTLNLGTLGTYVINKQTPNRQIWLSSPVSGPSRFDWDATTNTFIYIY
ncbi:frataxin, mitochondrial [Curcuma longa]|uniref:frataxin, mitochondrial n=1 Tax=Curcuma longa TaxID=136217 RepID=UPI003D9E1867